MRILFCGDIVGRSGREAVEKYVPELRQRHNLDGVIVNGENAAHGFGITTTICQELFRAGVDCITLGNHSWDQKEIMTFIQNEKRLVRPINYPAATPGRGLTLIETPRGHKVLVINVMGRLFMEALDDPFQAVEEALKRFTLGANVNAIVLDVHAEATSEKAAFGHIFDGRVSLVVGSHTHVPTADERILPRGTAYQTDAGMCGDYNSIVGMDKEIPIFKFVRRMPPPERMKPASGPGTLCGIMVDLDDKTGLAKGVQRICLGPHLVNGG